jgi:hypothetical protein
VDELEYPRRHGGAQRVHRHRRGGRTLTWTNVWPAFARSSRSGAAGRTPGYPAAAPDGSPDSLDRGGWCPGANVNASGVAVLMEMAQLFTSSRRRSAWTCCSRTATTTRDSTDCAGTRHFSSPCPLPAALRRGAAGGGRLRRPAFPWTRRSAAGRRADVGRGEAAAGYDSLFVADRGGRSPARRPLWPPRGSRRSWCATRSTAQPTCAGTRADDLPVPETRNAGLWAARSRPPCTPNRRNGALSWPPLPQERLALGVAALLLAAGAAPRRLRPDPPPTELGGIPVASPGLDAGGARWRTRWTRSGAPGRSPRGERSTQHGDRGRAGPPPDGPAWRRRSWTSTARRAVPHAGAAGRGPRRGGRRRWKSGAARHVARAGRGPARPSSQRLLR